VIGRGERKEANLSINCGVTLALINSGKSFNILCNTSKSMHSLGGKVNWKNYIDDEIGNVYADARALIGQQSAFILSFACYL
jgi:hypothetical protein